MFSLKSHLEQCYNIGSPRPSPTRSPFKSFPFLRESASNFELSPPRQSTGSETKSSKRKADQADLDLPSDLKSSLKKSAHDGP